MNRRFEYHFERVKVKGRFFGGSFSTDYQEIIRRYAQEGWRLVQVYAPATAGHGMSTLADLIFEREVH